MGRASSRTRSGGQGPAERLHVILSAYSKELRSKSMLDIHGFVLREGVAFKGAPLTGDEHAVVRAALGRKVFHLKACFYNSWRALKDDPSDRLVFVEGFRLDGGEPTHHAWLTIDGKVVDPTFPPPTLRQAFEKGHTLPRAVTILGEFPPPTEYVGVLFDREYILTTVMRRMAQREAGAKISFTFLDDWEDGWPIVEKGATGWRHVAGGE